MPCSPALAASIAALRARRFVCLAISSMIDILLAISFMAATASFTALPLSSALPADCMAIFSVCCALSAFCFMLAVISCIEDEVSSIEAACCVAPSDICWAVELRLPLPSVTLSAAVLTLFTTSLKPSTIVLIEFIKRPTSSLRFTSTVTVRSPSERSSATSTQLCSGPVIDLMIITATIMAINTPNTMIPTEVLRIDLKSADEPSYIFFADSVCRSFNFSATPLASLNNGATTFTMWVLASAKLPTLYNSIAFFRPLLTNSPRVSRNFAARAFSSEFNDAVMYSDHIFDIFSIFCSTASVCLVMG
ncbi:membrane protein [Candidatus Magnetobacterium bavaricum]|uniref:Membrane protein n=1 Tax=Candidatus Magnetobacterium bavaricum TaxID=29290 RepID=A0A0F3GQ27_9BACT|nr:membrane protein [Candidatus Magnetobacterium bavaricum]